MRTAVIGLTSTAVALVAVAAVFAGNPTKETIARTPAGNAEAAALVLKKHDLPAGWSGRSVKPDLSSSLGCSSYKPKQSDLVVIGAADTQWRNGPSTVDSQADVLRTPKMAKLDWKRTVADPRVLPCLRQAFEKEAPPADKLISLRFIPVPNLARYTKEYRLKMAIAGPTRTVKVTVDALVFGAGREELSLIASGLAADEPSLHKLQLKLARRLAKRLHG